MNHEQNALILKKRDRAILGASVALFGLIFIALFAVETPGLDLSHYFYLPIALGAVVLGPWLGALVGLSANGLYALALTFDPGAGLYQLDSSTSVLRFLTFVGIGIAAGSLARRNRDLLVRLDEEAGRDYLTGLLNLRGFDRALNGLRKRGEPFVLLLGDADDFKKINDRHGHARGNETLRQIASVLLQSVREGDNVARLGGDEFALLVAASKVQNANLLAQTFEERLAARGVPMSFGWASHPSEGDRDALFAKADERLYERKRARRPGTGALQVVN